jgi:hypothetical protein
MNKISFSVLAILAVLFVDIVPSQAQTISQFTVLTYAGTDIYVDGAYVDHSYGNWIMIYVPYGTHTIKVSKPGYFSFMTTVDVETKISSVFVNTMIPISTTNMLKAADDWSNSRTQITTQQLLTMADEWSKS